MDIIKLKNLKFQGADHRTSLLDVSFPKKGSNLACILFAHGFKGFKDWGHFPLIQEKLSRANFCVIGFNFSHNGGTAKNPIDFPDLDAFSENTYSKELDDIESLLSWVKKSEELPTELIDYSKIYILGHSRGGSIAILSAAKFPAIRKVVSWSAVANLESRLPAAIELNEWKEKGVRLILNGRTKQQMPMKYDFVEDLLSNREKLSVQKATASLNIPQLVIHGKADETVSVSAANEIKQWNPNAKIRLIEGANHTFNGKHPWDKEELPAETKEPLKSTIDFLNA